MQSGLVKSCGTTCQAVSIFKHFRFVVFLVVKTAAFLQLTHLFWEFIAGFCPPSSDL
jgi:hypothetical protein